MSVRKRERPHSKGSREGHAGQGHEDSPAAAGPPPHPRRPHPTLRVASVLLLAVWLVVLVLLAASA